MTKILLILFSFIIHSNLLAKTSSETIENIIIGDSLCTFIDNASNLASRLAPKGNIEGTHLWYGGTTLTWLKSAVEKYPVTESVKNVIISTGTNSAYAEADDIPGLVDAIRMKFPNAHLIVVPGSWWIKQPTRWVVRVSEEKVQRYYERFQVLGASITTPVGDSRICCNNDPHGNFEIYKKIGLEIDTLIEKGL
jgi:hypothetical protein